jgi:hypothetical protein
MKKITRSRVENMSNRFQTMFGLATFAVTMEEKNAAKTE